MTPNVNADPSHAHAAPLNRSTPTAPLPEMTPRPRRPGPLAGRPIGNPVVGAGLLAGGALAASALASSILPLLIALIGLLVWLVVSLRRSPLAVVGRPSVELRSPWQLVYGVFVTSVMGTLVAVLLAVVVNGFGIGGDGRLLLEVLVATFVLTPAFFLGRRCAHWWSCVGSAPAFVLVALSPSVTSTTFAIAIGCALALGSLDSIRSAGNGRRRA